MNEPLLVCDATSLTLIKVCHFITCFGHQTRMLLNSSFIFAWEPTRIVHMVLLSTLRDLLNSEWACFFHESN